MLAVCNPLTYLL